MGRRKGKKKKKSKETHILIWIVWRGKSICGCSVVLRKKQRERVVVTAKEER